MRVLVVDDSQHARDLVTQILQTDDQVEVIGQAINSKSVIELVCEERPDIVLIDCHTPGSDGLETTKRIMSECPTPIVILVSGSDQQSHLTMEALSAGALALIRKPVDHDAAEFDALAAEMINTVKTMGEVKVVRRRRTKEQREREQWGRDAQAKDAQSASESQRASNTQCASKSEVTENDNAENTRPTNRSAENTFRENRNSENRPTTNQLSNHQHSNNHLTGNQDNDQLRVCARNSDSTDSYIKKFFFDNDDDDRMHCEVIAIAASTGGPGALQSVIGGLPADLSIPVLIVQHIASGFAAGFVQWLNDTSELSVKVAEQGEEIVGGTIYVAPDDLHLTINARQKIQLSDGPKVCGFRPSANTLFSSIAEVFGASAIAVILSGMGEDGVLGLRSVNEKGGRIIAQDESTSVVYGMPGEAVAANIVDFELPIHKIAPMLVKMIDG